MYSVRLSCPTLLLPPPLLRRVCVGGSIVSVVFLSAISALLCASAVVSEHETLSDRVSVAEFVVG